MNGHNGVGVLHVFNSKVKNLIRQELLMLLSHLNIMDNLVQSIDKKKKNVIWNNVKKINVNMVGVNGVNVLNVIMQAISNSNQEQLIS